MTFIFQQADRQRLRAEEKLQEVRASHQQKQESARRKYEVLQERYRKLVVTRGERDLDDSQQKEAMELIVKEVSSSIIVARFQMLIASKLDGCIVHVSSQFWGARYKAAGMRIWFCLCCGCL